MVGTTCDATEPEIVSEKEVPVSYTEIIEKVANWIKTCLLYTYKEEVMDLSPRPFNGLLEPHHRDGSMVLDASRNLGYLQDLTPYGDVYKRQG